MPIGRQKPLDYSKGFGFKNDPNSAPLRVKPIKHEPYVFGDVPEIAPAATPQAAPTMDEPEYHSPIRQRSYRTEPVKQESIKQESVRQEPVPKQTTTPVEKDPREQFAPLQNSRSKRNKLVVSLVVDNSSSLTDEREQKLREALVYFNKRLEKSDIARDLDIAIFGFDGFSPRQIKGYDESLEISKFDNGGIQVLGKTIDLAMVELAERQKLYSSHNLETHKPWLIVLADGGAYGDITKTAEKLKKVLKERKVTYFPFSLNAGQLEESLDPITRLKMFLKVRDDMFVELFDFIFNTLETRINTPKDDLMRLDKKAIQGFIAR
jgi:uncharacterized protein YegL